MKIYTWNNKDLLDVLAGMGSHIHGLDMSSPTYADDIVLIALHKTVLQDMLHIAYRHNQRWRYEFNPNKSSVMIVGKDTNPDEQLRLGHMTLRSASLEKHLGIPVAAKTSSLNAAIDARISESRRSFCCALGIKV